MKARLGSICSFINGGTPSKDQLAYWEGNIPWITSADITSPTVVEARSHTTQAGISNSATSLVKAGTVLLVTRTSVGKVALAGVDLCFSQDITAVIPDPTKLEAGYLIHFLTTCGPIFDQYARGATIKGITRDVVESLEIPVYPLSEQHRIAAILDQAEALRAKRRAALAKLDTLAQSIYIEMFGDPATNLKGWPRIQLSQACRSGDDIKCGPFGTQLSKDEFTTEGVPLWGIRNVNLKFELPTKEFLDTRTAKRLAQYSIEPMDIVMTRKGTIGNCAVYPAAFPIGIMHSDLLRLRVDHEKCEPEFLAHQLHHSSDVERQIALFSGGAVMPGINVGRMKSIKVLSPPIRMQRVFGIRLAALNRLKSANQTSLAHLDALSASLQHSAFRGEL